MGALVWSYPGWRRFPCELSGFELRRFFALEAGGRRERRVRYPRRLRRPLHFCAGATPHDAGLCRRAGFTRQYWAARGPPPNLSYSESPKSGAGDPP